jgi:dTDP-4-amino-4,6-dideoxygalactose transaminase
MLTTSDYKNPFDAIVDFEHKLAKFTNAPYVVTTDCCTHAIELCFRYKQIAHNFEETVTIPKRTYLSIPMIFHKLDIEYESTDMEWYGEYNFKGTNVWDSARMLSTNMYQLEQMQCISFGRTKPLEIGRGGAILLDDKNAYEWLKRASYDGRDLNVYPWQDQKLFQVGYHYMMRPEECIEGMNKLNDNDISHDYNHSYPDISLLSIT